MKNLMVTFFLLFASALSSWGQVCFTDDGNFTNEIVINEQMSTSTGAWNAEFANYQFSGFNSAASGNGMVEFWTISPFFELAGATAIGFQFDLFEDFDSTNLELVWSSDYSGSGDPNAATWTNLETFDGPEQGGDDFTESLSLDLDGAITTPEGFYLAFVYIDDSDYSRWRVSNISLTSNVCDDPTCCSPLPFICGNLEASASVTCSEDDLTYNLDFAFTLESGGDFIVLNNLTSETLTSTTNTYSAGPFDVGTTYSYTFTAVCDENLTQTFENTEGVSCVGPPPFNCDTDGLYVAGVLDGPLPGGTPKAVQLCASGNIDLSLFGLSSVSNGGGSSNTFEFAGMSGELASGSCIWITTDNAQFNAYFGFDADYVDGVVNINGDDALEVYFFVDGDTNSPALIDVFGNPDVDGTGECWEYQDGYAVNLAGGINCGDFDCSNYSFSGPNALDDGMSYEDIGENVFNIEADPCATFSALAEVDCDSETLDYTVVINLIGGNGTYVVTNNFTNESDTVQAMDDLVDGDFYGLFAETFVSTENIAYSYTVSPLGADCTQVVEDLTFSSLDCVAVGGVCGSIYIAGVLDGPLAGGTPKAVQICASEPTGDLSAYGLDIASNGGGFAGVDILLEGEITLEAFEAGDNCFWITNDAAQFEAYFGFAADYENGSLNINGDDAIGIFQVNPEGGDDLVLTDVFGDPDTDGTGECWEYQDGYVVNLHGAPNCGIFNCNVFSFSGPNALDDGMSYSDIGEDVFNIGEIGGTDCTGFQALADVICDAVTNTYNLLVVVNGAALDGYTITNNLTSETTTFSEDAVTVGPFNIGDSYNYTVSPNCDPLLAVTFEDSAVNCNPGPGETGVCYTDETCDFGIRNVLQNSDLDSWLCSDGVYTANAFCGGSCTEASELWLVSPAFNFGTATDRTFEMTVEQGFGGDDLVVYWSADYDGLSDPTTATWTSLGTIANGVFTADIASLVGDNIYIGIQYTAGGGAGVTAQYTVSNIQISSDDCSTTALAPPPPCEANVGTISTVATEICPCNGDATTLSVTADGFAGTGFTQAYILANAAGLILDQSATGEFDVNGQANGDYQIYAINYEDIYAAEITPAFSIGQNASNLVDGIDGCYQISTAVAASINGTACACVVDCSGIEAPPSVDIVVCEGGNTTIVLGSTGEWVINEFLANPFDEGVSDANGDGVSGPSDDDQFQQSQDEFVEFVNNTGFAVDITGWTFRDATDQIRHTFPSGTVVPNGGAVVLFGAGNPTGDFGGAIVQVASGGFIGINDGGDDLSLVDGNNDLVVTYGYGGDQAIANISQTRFPDVTGDFVAHDSVNGLFFSPGTQVDGTPFTANNFVYNFYSDAALTDLLAGGVGFYDPQTAAGNTQTLYVTTVDGSCESEATEMTVTVTLPPAAEVQLLDTLCNITGGDYTTVLDLNDLIINGTGGEWTNVAGEVITTFDATDLPFGDYSVVYTLNASDLSPCPATSYIVTLRVINCGDACNAFGGPIAQNVNLCGDASTEIIPTGAGLTGLFAPEVFISELHYDNASFDENEGVELTGTAGLNLTGYQILAYNGNGGVIYETVDLVDVVIPNSGNGYGAVFIPINGLQNGPDGIALADNLGNLVEFYSYEGDVTANEGPADGVTATDLGVGESGSQEVGQSMQLTDAGWVTATANTYNAINEGLTVGLENPPVITYNFYSDAALTDLLASGNSYDPMTAAGASQSIWVNATDGTCLSDAVEFTIAVENAPTVTVQESATICLNNDNNSVDLESLILDGPFNGGEAFWSDGNGDILFFTSVIEAATYGTDTTVIFTYNVTPENEESVCASVAFDVSIIIETCVDPIDPCEDFAAPSYNGFAQACAGEEFTIVPTGGGNGGTVTYNFYSDAELMNLLATGESYSSGPNTTIYVTATEGTCESTATEVIVDLLEPITITPMTASICDDSTEGESVLSINQLFPMIEFVSHTFTDENGNVSLEIDGTDLGVGTYTYTITGTGDAYPCGPTTSTLTLTVEDCTPEPPTCDGFMAPDPISPVSFCFGDLINYSPTGGGNDENVSYNFYADADLTELLGTGTTYSLSTNPGTITPPPFNTGPAGFSSPTIYITAIAGNCESEAISVSSNAQGPISYPQYTEVICNDPSEGNTTITSLTLPPDGLIDFNGQLITSISQINGANLGVGTYQYTLNEGAFVPGPNSCDIVQFFLLTVIVEDCTPEPVCGDDPVITTTNATICNDANEGETQLTLSNLVSSTATGVITDQGGNVVSSINYQNYAPGNYQYFFTVLGNSPECPSFIEGFTVTVEDCEVDLTVCEDFIVQNDVICADDNETYYVILNFAGGNAGVNGYNVNVAGQSFNNVTDPIFSYGPLAGTGYSMTVAVADHPQCVETVAQTIVDCNPTAIELLEFDGTAEKEGNYLFWTTASERNTSHFSLYRSENGANFEKVNEQAAAGNSNTAEEYNFMDKTAPEGWSYYRLTSMDIDGTAENSEIVALYRKPQTALGINVSPIPATHSIDISYESESIENLSFQVVNVIGQSIETWNREGLIGVGTLQKDISQYAAGVYFLRIQQGTNVKVQKFVKE